jgi:hypothetical protein
MAILSWIFSPEKGGTSEPEFKVVFGLMLGFSSMARLEFRVGVSLILGFSSVARPEFRVAFGLILGLS